MRLQVHADRAHVPHDLAGRLLEREVERLSTGAARGLRKVRGQGALPRPGRAADQNGRTLVIPTAEHLIELFLTRGDALAGDLVVETGRGDRQDIDPVLVDEERVLVGAMGRAAVLDDAQATRGD